VFIFFSLFFFFFFFFSLIYIELLRDLCSLALYSLGRAHKPSVGGRGKGPALAKNTTKQLLKHGLFSFNNFQRDTDYELARV
jgi:hypothetical protein